VSKKNFIKPAVPPYTVTCPVTGWRVPMIESRQVHQQSRTIIELAPEPKKKSYRIVARSEVDDATWEAAARGTVQRDGEEFFLIHDVGKGKTRVRIANRAKAYLYCVEVQEVASLEWLKFFR
jgi:hypothetical protein